MSANQSAKVSKHGQVKSGQFLDKVMCENMEKYLAEHGSLQGMIKLKPKRETKSGTVSIPIKYIPDVGGDEFDISIYSKDIYSYGRCYNEEKKFSPELKQAKFTKTAFEKFDKDERGYYSSLKPDATIEKDDVNYNYRIREMLNQYLSDKIEEYQTSEKWGNPKDKKSKKKSFDVLVTNFDLKDGLNAKNNETFEDRLIPWISFKFGEDEGMISSNQPGREDYKLRILNKDKEVLDVSRDNINQIVPSRTRIRMVSTHKDLKITKFGISLSRYIQFMRIEETPVVSKGNFNFSDSESDSDEIIVARDDDE